ncbi:helicase-exonuclease AddAB subunit AddA [Alkalihalobacillus sp. LMS6]|uniref:helicase-exonuclease AddAB subunit AddA n=1 Tax=Alkalihalobacillus sp. LMS6 TaxID=2924034 RepID=UPI0020D136D5|nr:helicase-exonuclease AddAB subunit AddA [Alkalihalobacillus sp. LMS6]UTR07200.1 helicase-exonuclease AddAB subunit AddA [Alkalihalobacillus sp. LMS6]
MPKWEMQERPSDVTWTDEQWQAISLKGGNILVAAAAGSGKTAVLVERIVKRIMDPTDEAEIDRLLVVTFTKAAAAEMKERIGKRMEEELSVRPTPYLKRQYRLLNRATISTLHSFCSDLIRKHYYDIHVDPTIRLANDTERELLKEEVLEALLERYYTHEKEASPDFYTMAEAYSGDRTDTNLRALILNLYTRSRSHPDPDHWLERSAAMYEESVEDIATTPWGQVIVEEVLNYVAGARANHARAMALAEREDGPHFYHERLVEEGSALERLESNHDWDDLYNQLETFAWNRLPSKKKDDPADPELITKVKQLRDESKKLLQKAQELMVGNEAENTTRLYQMRNRVRVLTTLVQEFAKAYRELKEERSLMDFDDLEHFALEILSDGSIDHPSTTALQYRAHFQEVLTDEYQDTNRVQEAILNLVGNGQNRFMVGDVKQSIYRFRLAEPGLFIEKQDTYATLNAPLHDLQDVHGIRIDLAHNFRSRSEVLHAVNYVFAQTMDKHVGEVVYDNTQALRYGNIDYNMEDQGYDIHVALLEKEDEETSGFEPSAEKEARWTASKIQELITNGYPVFDKKTKQLRPIQYRDITILMRSLPSAPIYVDVFKAAGIPLYSDRDEGYFRHVEVQIMLSLLKIIDNPFQDIPLAAVLRSPIVGLTDEQLAHIRLNHVEGSLYEAVQATLAVNSEEEPSQTKLAHFYNQLQEWRVRTRTTPLSTFIWSLFSETDYDIFVGGLPGGKQRQANVRALYDRAKAFEDTSFRGIFRFLRFVERMEEQGDDFESARTISEQENVVRLMSIHKSKGLEFPVVFVVDMWKQFNLMDTRRQTQIHQTLGFGSTYLDIERRIKYSTIPEVAIKKLQEREQISEELRVLYVALTRAKEKLFMLGSVKDRETKLLEWGEQAEQALPLYDRKQARRFFDWVIPAVLRHADLMRINDPEPHESKWLLDERAEVPELNNVQTLPPNEHVQQLKRLEHVRSSSIKSEAEVGRRLDFNYQYPVATQTFAKQSVTELKRKYNWKEFAEAEQPQSYRQATAMKEPTFLKKQQKLSAAEKGTLMHRVMQRLSFTSEETTIIKSEVEAICRLLGFNREEQSAIHENRIIDFHQSSIGKRLINATKMKREVPFSYVQSKHSFAHKESEEDEDVVLIRGIIDVLFWDEDGELILLDYKTDRVQSLQVEGVDLKKLLNERYHHQMTQYKQAIESIWKVPVKECWLYFFDGGHEVTVK